MNNVQPLSTIPLTRSAYPDLVQALLWVHRATDAEALRPFCRYVHVRHTDDGDTMVLLGTDGARLHTARFQTSWFQKEGAYRVERLNADSVRMVPIDDPQVKLPSNVFDLLQFENSSAVHRIDFRRESPKQVYPSDLYKLIVELGIETDTNNWKMGFNPDYLVDAIGQAHEEIWRVSPRLLHLITEATKDAPRYHAVLMGIKLGE